VHCHDGVGQRRNVDVATVCPGGNRSRDGLAVRSAERRHCEAARREKVVDIGDLRARFDMEKHVGACSLRSRPPSIQGAVGDPRERFAEPDEIDHPVGRIGEVLERPAAADRVEHVPFCGRALHDIDNVGERIRLEALADRSCEAP